MDIKEDLRLVQLQGVPGLDVGVGLATTGQRVESLVRLLKKYAALHADADTRLRQAWSDQAIDVAHRLAHSLKGATGFLGLDRLQKVSTELDEALRTRQDAAQVEAMIEAFAQENRLACTAIIAIEP